MWSLIKHTLIPMLLTLLLGFGFGLLIRSDEINQQLTINKQLQLEYNELKNNYNKLEETYKGEQQELYQEIYNLQNKICFNER